MKVNLILQIIVLPKEQLYYLVRMNKKKTKSNSKEEKVTLEKSTGNKPHSAKNSKDFGGIPDIDPKKFLGCG